MTKLERFAEAVKQALKDAGCPDVIVEIGTEADMRENRLHVAPGIYGQDEATRKIMAELVVNCVREERDGPVVRCVLAESDIIGFYAQMFQQFEATEPVLLADGTAFVPGMTVYLGIDASNIQCVEMDETAHQVVDGWLRLQDEKKYPHDGLKHVSYIYSTRQGPIRHELKHVNHKIDELIERREVLEQMLR